MFHTYPATKLGHGGPNMTPMVDVVMCILIFFMLGSSFAVCELYLPSNTPAIDRSVGPHPGTEPIPAVRNYIRLRYVGGRTLAIAFGSAPMADLVTCSADPASTASLPDLLRVKQRQLSPDAQLIIAPDRGVPYQAVISTYDACRNARFAHVAFAPAGDGL